MGGLAFKRTKLRGLHPSGYPGNAIPGLRSVTASYQIPPARCPTPFPLLHIVRIIPIVTTDSFLSAVGRAPRRRLGYRPGELRTTWVPPARWLFSSTQSRNSSRTELSDSRANRHSARALRSRCRTFRNVAAWALQSVVAALTITRHRGSSRGLQVSHEFRSTRKNGLNGSSNGAAKPNGSPRSPANDNFEHAIDDEVGEVFDDFGPWMR